ncbi:MAG: hypothetical protein HZB56_12140 [Deltaproteobacteria bacterium]|nr:hypothetical protein [Deltaproteobacteria bacterium]
MSPRGGALAAAVAALLLSSGCREASAPGWRQLEARSCTLRLAGPLAGDLPCRGLAWRREEGWVLFATLEPGSRYAGSLQLLVRSGEGGQAAGPLPEGRAVFREPGRAGVGVIWGGVPRGLVRLALSGGEPVAARVEAVVSPLRANPVEEPLRVELTLDLGRAGLAAAPAR